MKNAQKLTRLLLVLLSLAMILSAFAACATEDEYISDADEESTEATEDGGSAGTGEGPYADWPVDANGYIMDRLPEEMNFQDDFVILSSDSQKHHFWADETDTTTVGQALYSRNETVAERLGVALTWKHTACYSTSDHKAFTSLCETDIKSGNEYDCVVAYNLLPYRLAAKGYTVNLKNTANIDLEAPWWPKEFLNNMLYQDQIYALVDNASVGTVTNLSGIFFNNDLLDDKGIESPYDLVAKNEWTVPKLKELIKDTYEDKNANGQNDGEGDIYGLCTSTDARLTCWYYGVGLRFSTIDEQGNLIFNTDVEDATNRIEAIVDLFSTEDSLVKEPGSQYIMFREERAYFYLAIISLCTHLVNQNIEINYGVAPIPKLNSEQDRYYTHVPNTHEAWYLLSGTKDLDCSSAFIECMASEAYRQVNEAFFETNVKLRYAPDERLAKMYDLIRESITFDFVFVYGDVIGWDINNGIKNCIKNPTQYQWATVWAGIKDSMNTKFQTVLDVYEQNVAS